MLPAASPKNLSKSCINVAVKNNKMWGFDYKKFNKNPTEEYFYKLQRDDFKNKFNLCLAIRENSSPDLIGEVILYKFDKQGNVEVGIRLFKKYQQISKNRNCTGRKLYLGGSVVKNSPTQETRVRFLDGEDPLEKEMATQPSLPRKSHEQRSLAGYSPKGHKESDTT